jgi:hypothetical protein
MEVHVGSKREKDNEWSSVPAADHAALSRTIQHADKRDKTKNNYSVCR